MSQSLPEKSGAACQVFSTGKAAVTEIIGTFHCPSECALLRSCAFATPGRRVCDSMHALRFALVILTLAASAPVVRDRSSPRAWRLGRSGQAVQGRETRAAGYDPRTAGGDPRQQRAKFNKLHTLKRFQSLPLHPAQEVAPASHWQQMAFGHGTRRPRTELDRWSIKAARSLMTVAPCPTAAAVARAAATVA